MWNMNITATITPVTRLPHTQNEAILFARSLLPAPRVRDIYDIAPAMKIIPRAINTMNIGAANETAASCNGSLVCPMKNVSARL